MRYNLIVSVLLCYTSFNSLQTVLPERGKLLLLLFRGTADAQMPAHSHKQENCKDKSLNLLTLILKPSFLPLSSPTPLDRELN